MSLKSSLFLVFITICQYNLIAQEKDWLQVEIEKIIRFDSELDYRQVPGFIVGVIDGDSTYIYSFGKYKTEKKSRQITKEDIFEIGSITKLYTSFLIQQLAKKGLCNLDDPANTYIPEPYKNPRLAHVTIHALINHQSGLPLRPERFGSKEKDSQNPYMYYTEKDLLEYYRDYIPEKEGFVYSHTNYALLEIIIQEITGLNFDDVFHEYITKPLNLEHTFIEFPEQKVNYIAPGYDKSVTAVNPWIYSSFRASEGVKTNMNDALMFLRNLLTESQPEVTEDSNNPGLPTGSTFNDYLHMEDGWHILYIKDKKMGIHTGRTSGHSGFMGMLKDSRTAVIILSNSWIGTGDLGLQILRMINNNWKF